MGAPRPPLLARGGEGRGWEHGACVIIIIIIIIMPVAMATIRSPGAAAAWARGCGRGAGGSGAARDARAQLYGGGTAPWAWHGPMGMS